MLKIVTFLAAACAAIAARSPVYAETAPRDVQKEEANRRLVLDFYDRVFIRRDLEGGTKAMSDDYKQHNSMIPDGKSSFVAFFTNEFTQYPDLKIRIVRVAADGDLVWLHVHITKSKQDPGVAAVDIFRVEHGKVVEHWDVMQPVPQQSNSGKTPF